MEQNFKSDICSSFGWVFSCCCSVFNGAFDFLSFLFLLFFLLVFLDMPVFCITFPSDSCCICVFVLYPCCMISAVNNKHKYIFLLMDSIV